MNSDQLSRQYYNLIEDCDEYYESFVSKQTEDIVIEEDEFYYIDYMGSNGIYAEATIVRLCKDCIIGLDRDLGEEIVTHFDHITISDKLQILEMYEENNFKQLS